VNGIARSHYRPGEIKLLGPGVVLVQGAALVHAAILVAKQALRARWTVLSVLVVTELSR
jgi:hypothetical protein